MSNDPQQIDDSRFDQPVDAVLEDPDPAFRCLRGASRTPQPRTDPPYEGSTWRDTQTVWVLPKATARELIDDDLLPAPRHLLVLRVLPEGEEDRVLRLTPLVGEQRGEPREFQQDQAVDDEGSFDARFLCVHGEGEATQDGLQGIQILDLTTDEPGGFASHLEVTTQRGPAETLRVVDRRFAFRFSC